MTAPGTSSDTNCRQLGLSASVMHVATGLYVSGAYGLRKDGNRKNFAGADAKDTDEMWWLQGGIERKYSDLGKTTVFGEYLVDDMGHQTNIAAKGFAEASGKMWGLGINQSLEAAVMDLSAYGSIASMHTPVLPRDPRQERLRKCMTSVPFWLVRLSRF